MTRIDSIKSYIPEFIHQSEPIKSLLESDGEEMGLLFSDIQEVLDQFYIDKATWGLSAWEKFYGIPIETEKESAFRRSVILAKKRGAGTVTSRFVKEIALAYENGEIEINELGNSTVEIKFVGIKGVPPNIDDFKNTMEEIKPGHIGLVYTLTFLTWDEFDGFNKNWDEWDALNLTWDEFEIYQGV